MSLFGDLLIFIVSGIFLLLSLKTYSGFIYPLLQRTYYRGKVKDHLSFKKDITYLGSMLLGWVVFIFIWCLYLFSSGYILKCFRPHEPVALISLIIYGSTFMVLIIATSWPRQIGSRVVRRGWLDVLESGRGNP